MGVRSAGLKQNKKAWHLNLRGMPRTERLHDALAADQMAMKNEIHVNLADVRHASRGWPAMAAAVVCI